MQSTQIPTLIPLPFANSGTKNAIPTASQVGITDGAASLTTGFPPLTFTPLAAGGVAPKGEDFNGILNLITQLQQWQSAGGQIPYDATFAASVGGYPKGAEVRTTDGNIWRSLVENNTTAPANGANWADMGAVLAALPSFASTKATNGYQRLPGGLILQWGTVTGVPQAGSNVAFPIAFPGGLFTVYVTIGDNGTTNTYKVSATNLSVIGFTAVTTNTQSTAIFWFAIGV